MNSRAMLESGVSTPVFTRDHTIPPNNRVCLVSGGPLLGRFILAA